MQHTGLHLRETLRSLTVPFLIILIGTVFTLPANAWTFISSPDWFNQDVADLSGATPGIPEAEGWDNGVSQGLNGISPQMLSVYDFMIGEMNTYSPELFLVAGDLINGRWFNAFTLDMFDPDTRSRTTAIENAADIYYPWYRLLFARHGINTVIGALGDHELGDDDWPAGSEKAINLNVMKQAFGRNMVDTLGLPAQMNGADARPYGTPFEDGSYAYQHNNLLVIAVDVFQQDDPNTNIHALFGTVSTGVSGGHLAWLATLLSAADQDPSIDHVILQGHTPVLRPVRMHITSGMMMVDREDSDFWQLLRQHDHRHGGKVRLYFCGEVHAVTASKDPESDIIQLAHGDPPRGAGLANVMVFNILPERIEIESREFVLFEDGTSLFWQVDQPVSSGPSSVMPSTRAGTLTIDTGGVASTYVTSGDLDLVDQIGLTIHFGFDQTTPSGAFSNTGSIGNHYYEGVSHGGLDTQAGMFGNALQLNGTDAYMESGRGNITEGESRTASAWIKSSSALKTQTVLSYGGDKTGINGWFNMQIDNGKLRLNIGPGISCVPDGASGIADGNWHHVAVVLTGRHVNRCADILFYVDGDELSSGAVNSMARLDTASWANIRVGAGLSTRSVVDFFNGAIDDAAIWGSALPLPKVRAIANAGHHAGLRYGASAMEFLFDLFDAKRGEVVIGNLSWIYISGLNGTGGDVLNLGDRIAIQLDEIGNGVAAITDATSPLFMDNGEAGTSSIGTWSVSAGVDPYGANSLYANAAGASYTYNVNLLAPGEYQVFAWWTEYSNRRTSVPYDITDLGGTGTVTVNQRLDGGQWNQLGTTWNFGSSATITIRSLGDGTTSADAIMLVPTGAGANLPPVLSAIGALSITAGDTLGFNVSASDNDGTTPLLSATGLPSGATFVDNNDGTGSFSWPTTTSDTGTYHITFTATDASDAALTDTETITVSVIDPVSSVVVDNGEAGTSSIGTWSVSAGVDPYGANSLYANAAGASYTYNVNLLAPGEYQVFAWWTEYSNRRTSVPYDITDLGGTGTVTVNQRLDGGQWNQLGTTWNFGSSATITIRSLGDGTTSADAIMLVPTSHVIMDNGEAGTSSIGTWNVSAGINPYGANSLYANAAGASYTYNVNLLAPGEYQVFAWWTEYSNRRTSVPYDITDLGGTGTVTVNQRLDGGQWNQLGTTWNFGSSATITIRSLGDGTTSADAIMLVPTGGALPNMK